MAINRQPPSSRTVAVGILSVLAAAILVLGAVALVRHQQGKPAAAEATPSPTATSASRTTAAPSRSPAASPGVTTTAPTTIAAPASLTARARAAADYGRSHGMTTGVALLDTRTLALATSGDANRDFASASVVKTMIATRLLLEHRMTGKTAMLAYAMITRSDNTAAWTLYPDVGRDGLLPWIARHYGIERLGARPTMPGIWGSTQITASGMVRFYAAVRRDPAVWPWLSYAMHHYAQDSSAGEPNAFGLAVAEPSAAVKNGWDTDRDVEHPTNAIINTTGFVDHDRIAVAILSEGDSSLYFRGGEKIVTEQARLVIGASTSGPSPTTPAASPTSSAPNVSGHPVVVLDPGHNGGNASHLAEIDKLVPAGYGVMKACNTTGTETDAGYPEHAFTWDVAKRVRADLEQHGVTVVMTRDSDDGVGPCVNERAAIESRAGVAAAVAIHADGAPSSGHGFHICVDDRRPVGASAATVQRTTELDKDLHSSLESGSGLSVSTYIGDGSGYYPRHDLAGLNLSTKPTSFLELGNMRNSHDAALQESAAGRARIAMAVATGILAYLGR